MSTKSRSQNLEKPGDYVRSPGWQPYETDSTDANFIKMHVQTYLADKYYDDKIIDCIENYYDEPCFKRKEFYFDFLADTSHILISGLYDHFLHIIIFVDFDSKQSFVDKAVQFFKIPPLDEKSISYDEFTYPNSDKMDYFYSYVDEKNKFAMAGYPVWQYNKNNNGEFKEITELTALDLTIYTNK